VNRGGKRKKKGREKTSHCSHRKRGNKKKTKNRSHCVRFRPNQVQKLVGELKGQADREGHTRKEGQKHQAGTPN